MMSSTSYASTSQDKGKLPDRRQDEEIYSQSNSVLSRFLATYDAKNDSEKEMYYEVPPSHFLARPAGSSNTPTTIAQNRDGSSSSISQLALSRMALSTTSADINQKSSNSEKSSASFVTVLEAPLMNASVSIEHSSDELKSTLSYPSLQEDRDAGLFSSPSFAANIGSIRPNNSDNLPSFFGGQRPHMPDTSTLAAADFDIDVRSGFLPPQEPVSRLEGIEEELWEVALDRARELPLRIGGGGKSVTKEARKQARQWRKGIREMLILHPSPQLTSDIRFARRAHVVLAFLTHFYMHSLPEIQKDFPLNSIGRSQDEQDEIDEAKGRYHGIVPASLAIPWVSLSQLIDIPPVLTYATTVMWNWGLIDPKAGFVDNNLRMTTTFSGTRSEEHFYLTSLLIEKRGVEALTLMRKSLDEAFVGDTLALRRIRNYLNKLAKVLNQLQILLHDVRTDCDPSTFYWGIRPWFNGADSFIDKETGEKGWIYEGVEEYGGRRMLFMGPSAGQSSLIHSIDVFLGVDHSGRGGTSSENGTFMERMQTYMPGHHRNFLNHLKSISFSEDEDQSMEEMQSDSGSTADETMEGIDEGEEESQRVSKRRETHPLRALMVIDDNEEEDSMINLTKEEISHRNAIERLRESYNDSLNSLKHLRDEHMRIATLYIISQMRTSPPSEYALLNEALISTKKNSNSNSMISNKTKKSMDLNDILTDNDAKGTGGTNLVSFLKDCRKNTVNTLIAKQ